MAANTLTIEQLRKVTATLEANRAPGPFFMLVSEEVLKQNFGLTIAEAQALYSATLVESDIIKVPLSDDPPTQQEVIEQVDDLALEIERNRRHDAEQYMARTRGDFVARMADAHKWADLERGPMAGPVIERDKQERDS